MSLLKAIAETPWILDMGPIMRKPVTVLPQFQRTITILIAIALGIGAGLQSVVCALAKGCALVS